MQLSDLQYLMHQLGPAMPEIDSILQEDTESWHVVFHEDVGVQVSWQQQPSRVILSCAIGEAREEAREQIYARLLVANSLPLSEFGLRFALSFPGQQVLVLSEREASALSVDAMAAWLREFLLQADQVSSFLEDCAATSDTEAAGSRREEPSPSQLA